MKVMEGELNKKGILKKEAWIRVEYEADPGGSERESEMQKSEKLEGRIKQRERESWRKGKRQKGK